MITPYLAPLAPCLQETIIEAISAGDILKDLPKPSSYIHGPSRK